MGPQELAADSVLLTEALPPPPQVLYPILPDLLHCNPFRRAPDQPGDERLRGPGSSGLQVPAEVQSLVEVLSATWRLLSDCQLHQEISSQLIGYLFYFINASLFNSLMERGTGDSNDHNNKQKDTNA